jgi:hypothetical protein
MVGRRRKGFRMEEGIQAMKYSITPSTLENSFFVFAVFQKILFTLSLILIQKLTRS